MDTRDDLNRSPLPHVTRRFSAIGVETGRCILPAAGRCPDRSEAAPADCRAGSRFAPPPPLAAHVTPPYAAMRRALRPLFIWGIPDIYIQVPRSHRPMILLDGFISTVNSSPLNNLLR